MRWYFTFGEDHLLAKYYLVLDGSFEETRNLMFNNFDSHWAMQYSEDEFNKGIPINEKWGLIKLN